MSTDSSYETTIIGGGIVGICCGLALVEAGMRVLLIDKNDPGQGASYGNAGIVSPWSLVPQSVPGLWQKIPRWLLSADGPIAVKPSYLPRLAPWVIRFLGQGRRARVNEIADAIQAINRDNIELYRQLLHDTGETGLIRDSYYVHAFRNARQADPDGIEYAIRRDRGAEIELISRTELQALEPALSPQFEAAILIKNQARALSPGRLGSVLMEKYLRLGGRHLRAEVTGLRRNGNDWTLSTGEHIIDASQVVISAGAWSKRLLKPLAIDVPLETERGYHLEYPDPGLALNHSVMDVDHKVVASSMEGGLRAAGVAEFAGLDAPPNSKRIDSLHRLVKSMLPGLNTTNGNHWMGSRPSMPDSLPCIGEFERHRGLFAAFGHGHFGLMMAPKTGRIIADMVLGRQADLDLRPYRPQRFT